MATFALLVGGANFALAQVTDVSNKLVASGTNWPTFSSEKTGNSDNAPWQGQNVTIAEVKGACTLSDFTEVQSLQFTIQSTDNDTLYDLQGRSINAKAKPGLYISNGNKVVIK